MNEHVFKGCTTNQASSYLKALGLIKILSENDRDVTACWKNDELVIVSSVSIDEIIKFLMNEYKPSPIIAPWSYSKYDKMCKSLRGINVAYTPRLVKYVAAIKQMDVVFEKFRGSLGIKTVDKDQVVKNKELLLSMCRNYLPDDAIPWLDAVFVLDNEKPRFAPLLGTGGNDGNFDIAENFLKCLNTVLFTEDSSNKSKEWLRASICGGTVSLQKRTTIGHDSRGTGGVNFGMGFEGKSLSNPWDYVLMVEGVVLFAGSMSKRLSGHTSKAVFPFTTDASTIGYPTASYDDHGIGGEPASRGEIWFPVWENPATYKEIRHVFNEGRAQVGNKPANLGTEFMRAAITLGVERGISKFERFCILKRKGKAYLMVGAGSIHTADDHRANLLDEIDSWYQKIRRISEKNASGSLNTLIRNLDKSIMRFCSERRTQDLLRVLEHVGKLERFISCQDGFIPLQKLSESWLEKCYDQTPEFRLAASVASLASMDGSYSIRENLENIVFTNKWEHRKDSTSCVWKEGDSLLRNLVRILQRRSTDGRIKSKKTIPIHGHIYPKISDIVAFHNGKLDHKKIANLILPLSMIQTTSNTPYPWKNERTYDAELYNLPEAYATLKMLYPSNEDEGIPYDTFVLNMLTAKRFDDAYSKASYILHAHQLTTRRHSNSKATPQSTTMSNVLKEHLTASMIIPIGNTDRMRMSELVMKDPNPNTN